MRINQLPPVGDDLMVARIKGFSQRDLTRAVKAVRAAGVEPNEFILRPTGEILLRAMPQRERSADAQNDFDREFG